MKKLYYVSYIIDLTMVSGKDGEELKLEAASYLEEEFKFSRNLPGIIIKEVTDPYLDMDKYMTERHSYGSNGQSCINVFKEIETAKMEEYEKDVAEYNWLKNKLFSK